MSDLKELHLYQPLGASPYDSASSAFRFFSLLLEKELDVRKQQGLDWQSLLSYYRNLFDSEGRYLPVGMRGYEQRIYPALADLLLQKRPSRILDAGSGYGTESYLFSLLGHSVTGVELVEERSAVANSRRDFFSSCCDFALEIEFVNAHILRFLKNVQPFDVIWGMEAISHIYPQEDFFELAYNRLIPGGKLIVSDPNRRNPLAWLRAVKIRGGIRHTPHQRFLDPETGAPTDYGQEQIYTIPTLKKQLEQVGFRINCVDVSGYMGSSFLPDRLLRQSWTASLLQAWQNLCRAIPGIRRFGSIYTIVAEK